MCDMKKVCLMVMAMVAISSLLILGKEFSNREKTQNIEIVKCDIDIANEQNSSNIAEVNEYQKINVGEEIPTINIEKVIVVCSAITFLFIVSVIYEITT